MKIKIASSRKISVTTVSSLTKNIDTQSFVEKISQVINNAFNTVFYQFKVSNSNACHLDYFHFLQHFSNKVFSLRTLLTGKLLHH